MTAGWAGTVLWWHVYPLGFTGAPIRPEAPAADATTVECGTGRLAGDRVRLPARGWAVLTA